MSLSDLSPFSGKASTGNINSTAQSFNPINVIASGRGYLDTLTNKFILKPANAKGLAGFVFDYEGETQITVQSEITDHYSEQNTFTNDHAAQRPQKITLRGFVGELSYNPNVGLLGALNVLQAKLTTMPALLGKYTPSVTQKISKAVQSATAVVNKVDSTINKAQNIVGLFVGSSPGATKQQKAYRNLYSLWANNTVFTLDTPFNYFTSVMIETIVFVQDETTKDMSEISVTVKEVRFTGVDESGGLSAQAAAQKLEGRAAQQGQAQTKKGITSGITTAFSKATAFFNKK